VRLTLDTNVVIAAFVARGACHELLEHCERHHEIVTSEYILHEFETKLLRKFRVPAARAAEAVALVRSRTLVVEPAELSAPACRDPDDDRVLATAVQGGCACIVTGDRDLLVLGAYEEIPILSPQAFWAFEARRGRD
jgi:uncharacterized protein